MMRCRPDGSQRMNLGKTEKIFMSSAEWAYRLISSVGRMLTSRAPSVPQSVSRSWGSSICGPAARQQQQQHKPRIYVFDHNFYSLGLRKYNQHCLPFSPFEWAGFGRWWRKDIFYADSHCRTSRLLQAYFFHSPSPPSALLWLWAGLDMS